MSAIRVKICGVTTPADAAFAADCGADAVGLNFYPESPRYVDLRAAQAITHALPPFAAPVGVFVETPGEEIKRVVDAFGLRGVQTYTTDDTPLNFFPATHIPACRVRDALDLLTIRNHFLRAVRACPPPKAILIDSFVPGEMGGTGHKAPWELLVGYDLGVPVILAGGLTPDNVAEAIRLVRPWGVDVASGVESAPGRKDPGKVRAFVQAAKAALLEYAS